MTRLGMQEDEIIESKFVSRAIERAQEKVEKHNFEIRKHLIEYDDVLNQQRTVIYDYRRSILFEEDGIYDLVRDFMAKTIQDIFAVEVPTRKIRSDQVEAVFNSLQLLTSIPVDAFKQAGFRLDNSDQFKRDAINFVLEKYQLYRGQGDVERIQMAEKWLMLETIDQAWKQHMVNIDHLKEGIGLRGWGQKNPLIEYKREAFDMFKDMMVDIRRDIVRHIFHLNVEQFNARELEAKREKELDKLSMISGDGSVNEEARQPVQRAEPKVGRNDPCPCGSGKKYKKCCGRDQ